MCLASITIHCKPVHVVALYVAKLKHIHVLSKETKNAVQYNCGSGPEAAPARRAAHVSSCWSQAALLSSTTSRKKHPNPHPSKSQFYQLFPISKPQLGLHRNTDNTSNKHGTLLPSAAAATPQTGTPSCHSMPYHTCHLQSFFPSLCF